MHTLQDLIDFLDELEERDIYFRLNKIRDSILVEVAIPGERWEVEFMYSGEVLTERFVTEAVVEEGNLEDLLKRWDPEEESGS